MKYSLGNSVLINSKKNLIVDEAIRNSIKNSVNLIIGSFISMRYLAQYF